MVDYSTVPFYQVFILQELMVTMSRSQETHLEHAVDISL